MFVFIISIPTLTNELQFNGVPFITQNQSIKFNEQHEGVLQLPDHIIV